MKVTNPTVEEIRSWAYSNEDLPHDEWDLFLSWTREVDLFIELAIDHHCPKKSFFLHMLYYIIGTTFSEPSKTDKLERIRYYAERGAAIDHGAIKAWRLHISDLLSGREKYSYDNWRAGRHAGYQFT